MESSVVHCVHECKNTDNVHSGARSQEITFDFVSAEAGIWRHAQTIPGHRYRIGAWAKHVRSDSPVELSLGVDLTCGQDWQAGSVTWHAWEEAGEDVWVHTHIVVKATGDRLTLFLKGFHPFAMQGVQRCLMMCVWRIWGGRVRAISQRDSAVLAENPVHSGTSWSA